MTAHQAPAPASSRAQAPRNGHHYPVPGHLHAGAGHHHCQCVHSLHRWDPGVSSSRGHPVPTSFGVANAIAALTRLAGPAHRPGMLVSLRHPASSSPPFSAVWLPAWACWWRPGIIQGRRGRPHDSLSRTPLLCLLSAPEAGHGPGPMVHDHRGAHLQAPSWGLDFG